MRESRALVRRELPLSAFPLLLPSDSASPPTAMLLPLAPTASELPWTIENLRFCNWCDELTQKDLNDCPHCGRRMEPLGS